MFKVGWFSVRWSGTGSNSWTNEPTDRMAGACSQIDARGSSWAPLFVHLLLHTPLYSLLTLLILPHYTIPRSRIQNQGCVTSSFLPLLLPRQIYPSSFSSLFSSSFIFSFLYLSLSSSLFSFSPRYDTMRYTPCRTISYHARWKMKERFFRSRKISNFSPEEKRRERSFFTSIPILLSNDTFDNFV